MLGRDGGRALSEISIGGLLGWMLDIQTLPELGRPSPHRDLFHSRITRVRV
jgi:hypothetical protein